MKKIFVFGFQFLLFLIVMDFMVLAFSLGQIAVENRTGEWNPFWAKQAELLVRILN